jgi:hypothetical protein
MSESFHATAEQADEETGAAPPQADAAVVEREEIEPTGDDDVDAVVASLAQLDELPVSEHVAVFEQAHDSLRRTLVGAGHDGPAAGRS